MSLDRSRDGSLRPVHQADEDAPPIRIIWPLGAPTLTCFVTFLV